MKRLIYNLNSDINWEYATLEREENQPPCGTYEVDTAYDHIGIAYQFFNEVILLNSPDMLPEEIICGVNADSRYVEAVWDIDRILLGEGDGTVTTNFAYGLDIITHELSHSIIKNSTELSQELDAGSIIEHFCDVFGIMCRHWYEQSTGSENDWKIGSHVILAGNPMSIISIRDFQHPGAVYNKIKQADHMSAFKDHQEFDPRLVKYHNAGILNRLFYFTATNVDSLSYQNLADIWISLLYSLPNEATISDFRNNLIEIAAESSYFEEINNAIGLVGL